MLAGETALAAQVTALTASMATNTQQNASIIAELQVLQTSLANAAGDPDADIAGFASQLGTLTSTLNTNNAALAAAVAAAQAPAQAPTGPSGP